MRRLIVCAVLVGVLVAPTSAGALIACYPQPIVIDNLVGGSTPQYVQAAPVTVGTGGGWQMFSSRRWSVPVNSSSGAGDHYELSGSCPYMVPRGVEPTVAVWQSELYYFQAGAPEWGTHAQAITDLSGGINCGAFGDLSGIGVQPDRADLIYTRSTRPVLTPGSGGAVQISGSNVLSSRLCYLSWVVRCETTVSKTATSTWSIHRLLSVHGKEGSTLGRILVEQSGTASATAMPVPPAMTFGLASSSFPCTVEGPIIYQGAWSTYSPSQMTIMNMAVVNILTLSGSGSLAPPDFITNYRNGADPGDKDATTTVTPGNLDTSGFGIPDWLQGRMTDFTKKVTDSLSFITDLFWPWEIVKGWG